MGLFDSWQKGVSVGKENRRDRIMGEFGQKALGGDQDALAQVYGVDTNAGMQLQRYATQQAATQRKVAQEDAGQAALMFAKTKRPEFYTAWRQSMATLPNAPQLPEMLEPGEIEAAAQSAQAFAQAYGGFKGMETPSAIRELEMLQANPELARLDMQRRQASFGRPQLIQTADGYAWATPEGASPLNYGGQPGPQSGQPFTIDPSLPPNVQAAIRNNEQAWATAPDQAAVQLPPVATGPRVMPAAKEKAPGALQEKLALARQMGATPEQLKQMVMGDSAGGGKQSATQIKLANTAKAKLVDLTAIDNQLAKVEQTFKPLQNSYSAGPLVGGLIPSEDGKRFDAAVSLLQGMVRKLTRTPGEGAMSDYETKLAQLANPSRSEYESVTADQIQQLRALIKTTREGYEALLQDAGGNSTNVPKPGATAGGGLTAEEQAELDQLRAHFGRK